MADPDAPGRSLVVARIGKIHGLKGWVRVTSYTSPPENLLNFRHFESSRRGQRRQLELTQARWQGDKLLAHFANYDDPEQARELTGLELHIDGASLPTLPAGEYYWHQLIGLRVTNLQGQILGRVSRLLETGANDVLVVAASADSIDQRERLIPFIRDQVIKSVAVEQQELSVDWQADYLA